MTKTIRKLQHDISSTSSGTEDEKHKYLFSAHDATRNKPPSPLKQANKQPTVIQSPDKYELKDKCWSCYSIQTLRSKTQLCSLVLSPRDTVSTIIFQDPLPQRKIAKALYTTVNMARYFGVSSYFVGVSFGDAAIYILWSKDPTTMTQRCRNTRFNLIEEVKLRLNVRRTKAQTSWLNTKCNGRQLK
ncbi:hypothetical protein EDB81DRAFT_764886 [Dactylonectria macrodidyma]|uniref:Uncharacterized protein n=1 Tax=Dactylonectria macrodidyma TaxID=307937 RepID=A0A9P9DTL2_9HYPO|nr:hypothetical protein EDB81DRAFT_764886 [Dactylonectria macrodidyma]